MTIEDGTHSGSRNVVGKFTLHTVQNPQNKKVSVLGNDGCPGWLSRFRDSLRTRRSGV
jgi:hypothetical protein